MARITTPFDSFVADVSTWLDSAWFVWIALAAAVVVVVVAVSITKARARARARMPQYRRSAS